jgi:hypothetical protein
MMEKLIFSSLSIVVVTLYLMVISFYDGPGF